MTAERPTPRHAVDILAGPRTASLVDARYAVVLPAPTLNSCGTRARLAGHVSDSQQCPSQGTEHRAHVADRLIPDRGRPIVLTSSRSRRHPYRPHRSAAVLARFWRELRSASKVPLQCDKRRHRGEQDADDDNRHFASGSRRRPATSCRTKPLHGSRSRRWPRPGLPRLGGE
jgi:hypothetical protein